MGEAYFRRSSVYWFFYFVVISLFGILLLLLGNEKEKLLIDSEDNFISGMAVHPLYNNFASAENGVVFNNTNNLLTVSDTAIYRTAYYSINGSAWESFSLSGNSYTGNNMWIRDSASYYLPEFNEGEHYIIIYGCMYNTTNSSWDCHGNSWQLTIVNVTPSPPLNCSDIVCEGGEYCFEGVCLIEVTGNTYFVSPNGNDSNSGNFSHPWKTWTKGIQSAHSGDIVYFRGGIYPTEVTDGTGIRYLPNLGIGNHGYVSNYIRYFNYPGEIPILDGSESFAVGENPFNFGIYMDGVQYTHIKGLQVRNFFQRSYPNSAGTYDIPYAINTRNSDHLKFENVVASYTHGIGFESYNDKYIEYINCDSHSHIDYYHATLPGGYGAGWHGSGDITTGYKYIYGCRAWNNSDQGFAASGPVSLTVFDNCWSYDNGALNGDGHGFKLGYWTSKPIIPLTIKLVNCIAANNLGDGYTGNENTGTYAAPMNIYNNLAYNSGRFGFVFYNTADTDESELKRILKNNLAYQNDGPVQVYIQENSLYSHSNNSWDSPVNVNNDDFESLDVSQLYAPRKPDGSLPDITFGKLKAGSDLIDVGVDVGINYSGLAPDLGAFESSFSLSTCGNGNCDNGETCANCESDCGCIAGYGCNSGVCIDLGVQSLAPIWCGFHAIHTNYSDGTMSIYQSVNSLKNYYQCGSTNDHDAYPSPYNQTKWTETINLANEQNVDYNFTYFFGMEWSGGQHIHYITMNPSPTPKYVTDANFNTVAELAEWLSLNSGLAQINHPARTSGGTDFSNPTRYNETWIPLVEFKNNGYWHWNYYWNCSQNSGCTTYQNPNLPGETANATKWIKTALDNGIHLGFSCGNDYHGGLPFAPFCYTGIAAQVNLTRQEIYNELKSRHTWVGEEKTIINLNANNGSRDFTMGDIFNTSNPSITISYIVNASQGNTVLSVNLFYNGVIVNVSNYSGQNIFGSITWNLTRNEEDYMFLEVVQSNGKRAWSSPIWVTYS